MRHSNKHLKGTGYLNKLKPITTKVLTAIKALIKQDNIYLENKKTKQNKSKISTSTHIIGINKEKRN